MIKCLIVDDEELAREKIKNYLNKEKDFELVGEASDGLEAREKILTLSPELVFLDIKMPELSGIDLVAKLKKIPHVIFVTAFDDFAVKAFELNALDYLLKPFDRERFRAALEKAKEKLKNDKPYSIEETLKKFLKEFTPSDASKKFLKSFTVKTSDSYIFIDADTIKYFQSAGNYVNIHSREGKFIIRNTLSKVENLIDPELFLRISRSEIVNKKFIKEIKPLFNNEYRIILSDGEKLKSGRTYKECVTNILND